MPDCPSCGEHVDENASFCPSCGKSLNSDRNAGTSGRSRSQTGSSQTERGEPASGSPSTPSSRDDSLPVASGLLSGIGAFVAGYLVTYAVKSGEAAAELGDLSGLGSSPATWEGVGWVFYVMHNVPVKLTGSGAGGSISRTFSSGALQDSWLLLVPVAALLLAGFYVSKNADARTTEGGAKAGATVTAGYLPLAAVFAVLTGWSLTGTTFGQSFTVSVSPSLTKAVLLAGIVYPVVFGALGGVLAQSTND